ncbi:hypothetical protein [Xanthomonas citri]|uniref:hypothetical protein n=1 Tax=Xanthomonas citri TaxID=346 RepID=UPI00131D4B4C|nr:hypothetical protein [Xanthomonas citri]
MIINVLPSPEARPARYRHALVQLLNQDRPDRHELDRLRAQQSQGRKGQHTWSQQLTDGLEPLTPPQADWLAGISDREPDFQRVLAKWISAGTPLVQRDYHALRTLEFLAEEARSNGRGAEA